MSVTFHRAFDATRDPFEAIETLLSLRVDRVLTSGGSSTALAAISELVRLVDASRGKIAILAGGGVSVSNVAEILRSTGVREIHVGSSVCESYLGDMVPLRPGIVAAFPESGSTTPFERMPRAQFVAVPYLFVTMCAPVTRSNV